LLKVGEIQLDKLEFGVQTCSGIALTPIDNNLYIASYTTDEILAISRDGQTELGRFSLEPANLDGPDGINVISGAGDLLILSTNDSRRASSGRTARSSCWPPLSAGSIRRSRAGPS